MSELIACHHKVTLDIAKRDVCTIEVVNRDTANILEVNVCENGKEVSLENATLITITYSNDTVEEMQISEDFKTASVRINANCLKRGINFAKVCIYSGDNGLITAEMLTINCKQTVGSDNPSVPDPDMPKLKEMIEDAVAQAGGGAGLEPLVGTTQTITPSQVLAAIKEGRDIALQYTDSNHGTFVFGAFNANEKLGIVASNSILPQMDGLTGTLMGGVEGETWFFKATNTPTMTDLDTAVNEALAAAKASGEFDGTDGITPTIGDNGNWYLGDVDTNKPSRGEQGPAGPKGDTGGTGPQGPRGEIGPQGPEGPQGIKGDTGAQGPQGEMGPQGPQGEKGTDGATGATGADGKSAYSYAVDGGYTGTEAEFAAKLAAESIDKALFVVNITTTDGVTFNADKTFEEITQAYNEGKYSIVAKFMGVYIMPLLAIISDYAAMFGAALNQGGRDVVSVIIAIAPDNSIQMIQTPLVKEGDTLPNPHPLTFTGAVNETYDGSSAKTIEIPSGGGGGSAWHTIGTQKMDGVETAVSFDLNGETIIQIIVTANYNEALTATKATVSLTLENGITVDFTPQTMNASVYSPKNIFTIFGNSKQCRQMIFSKAEGVVYNNVQGSFGVAYGYDYYSEHMVEDKIATGITITFDQAPSNAAVVKVEGM